MDFEVSSKNSAIARTSITPVISAKSRFDCKVSIILLPGCSIFLRKLNMAWRANIMDTVKGNQNI